MRLMKTAEVRIGIERDMGTEYKILNYYERIIQLVNINQILPSALLFIVHHTP